MAPEVSVRKLTSEDVIRLERIRRERNEEWEEMEWEWDTIPLIEGPGPTEENPKAEIKITNEQNSSWTELFNAQRSGDDKFCDVHIIADDGHVRVHAPFLLKQSEFLETIINEGYVKCKEDVISITLSDVKLVHLKVVLSLVYGGRGIIRDEEKHCIDSIIKMLQIKNFKYQYFKCNSAKKGKRVRSYTNHGVPSSVWGPSSQASIVRMPVASRLVAPTPSRPSAEVEHPKIGGLLAELPVFEKVNVGSGYKKTPGPRIKRHFTDNSSSTEKPQTNRRMAYSQAVLSTSSASTNAGTGGMSCSKDSTKPSSKQSEGSVSAITTTPPPTKIFNTSPGILQIRDASIILDCLTDEVIDNLIERVRQGNTPQLARHNLPKSHAYVMSKEKTVIVQPDELKELTAPVVPSPDDEMDLQPPGPVVPSPDDDAPPQPPAIPVPVSESLVLESDNPAKTCMEQVQMGGKRKRRRRKPTGWSYGRKKRSRTTASPSTQRKGNLATIETTEANIETIAVELEAESIIPNQTTSTSESGPTLSSSAMRDDFAVDGVKENGVVLPANASLIENEIPPPVPAVSNENSDAGTLTTESVPRRLDPEAQLIELRRKMRERINLSNLRGSDDDDEPTPANSSSISSTIATAPPATDNAETSNSATSNTEQNVSTEQLSQIIGEILRKETLEPEHSDPESQSDSTAREEPLSMEIQTEQESGANNSSASPVDPSSSSLIDSSAYLEPAPASEDPPSPIIVFPRSTAQKGIKERSQSQSDASTSQGTPLPTTPTSPTSFSSNVFRQLETPSLRGRPPGTATPPNRPAQQAISMSVNRDQSILQRESPTQPKTPVLRPPSMATLPNGPVEQAIPMAVTRDQSIPRPQGQSPTQLTNATASELETRPAQNTSQGQQPPPISSYRNIWEINPINSNFQQNQQINTNAPATSSVPIPPPLAPTTISSYQQRTIVTATVTTPPRFQSFQSPSQPSISSVSITQQQTTPITTSTYQQRTIVAATVTPPRFQNQSQPFLGVSSQSQTLTVQPNLVNTLQTGATTGPRIRPITMTRQTLINHVANRTYQNQQRSPVSSSIGSGPAGSQPRHLIQTYSTAPLLNQQPAPVPPQVQGAQNIHGFQNSAANPFGTLGYQTGYNFNPSAGAISAMASLNQSAHYRAMQSGGGLNLNPLGGGRAMPTASQLSAANSQYNIQQQPQAQMTAMQEIRQLQQPNLSNIPMDLGTRSQNNQIAITNNNTIIFMPQQPHAQQSTLQQGGAVVGNFGGGQLQNPSPATSAQQNSNKKFRCSSCSLLFSSETSLREHEQEGFCD